MRFEREAAVLAAQFRMLQVGEAALGGGAAFDVAAAILREDLLKEDLLDGGVVDLDFCGAGGGQEQAGKENGSQGHRRDYSNAQR